MNKIEVIKVLLAVAAFAIGAVVTADWHNRQFRAGGGGRILDVQCVGSGHKLHLPVQAVPTQKKNR